MSRRLLTAGRALLVQTGSQGVGVTREGDLRKPRRGLAVLDWVLIALPWLTSAHAMVPEEDPESRFKRWLESPPAVERLLVRERLPPILNRPVPLDTGIERSTNFTLFELRWQSNAMLVRTLPAARHPTKLPAPEVAFSLWNDAFTFLEGGTNAFVYHFEHDRVRRGVVPPAYDGAWFRVSRYGEVLNLGLSHLWPGSVRWEGTRFRALGLADKKPMDVSGEILRWSNGIPCEMSALYSNDMGIARYRLAYEYAPHATVLFPARIRLFLSAAGREVEYRCYDILSLSLARGPLTEEHFRAVQLAGPGGVSVRYLTNDSIYARLPSGTMLETAGAPVRLHWSGDQYYRHRYFYVLVGLVSVFFAVLMIRMRVNESR